jgi:CcmD family protein
MQKAKGRRQKAKGRRTAVENTRRHGVRAWLAAAGLMIALAGMPAMAQQPPGGTPDGFVPVDTLPATEQLPAAPLLIGAYAVAWVVVFGYLWSIWRRLGRVERELVDVSRRIAGGRP